MNPKIQSLREEAKEKISSVSTLDQVEQLRIHYLGKKGGLTQLLQTLRDIPASEKPQFGKEVNELKGEITLLLSDKQTHLDQEDLDKRPLQ